MYVAIGEKLFGQVERVPGVTYVSTQFAHVCFVPIWPLRSYRVAEGSEDFEEFQGLRIPLNFKSVLIGYLRGWLGAAAVLSTLVTALVVSRYFAARQNETVSTIIYVVVFGVLLGLVRHILIASTRSFVAAQALIILLTALLIILLTALWWALVVAPQKTMPNGVSHPAVQIWPATLLANATLLAFGPTRLCTHAHSPSGDVMPAGESQSSPPRRSE